MYLVSIHSCGSWRDTCTLYILYFTWYMMCGVWCIASNSKAQKVKLKRHNMFNIGFNNMTMLDNVYNV